MTEVPDSLVQKIKDETDQDWTPYGIRKTGVTVKKVPELSQAQCDALATLSAPLGPAQRLKLQQTWSESGGTHLYVRVDGEDEYHIAANGNVTSLGAQLPKAPSGPDRRLESDEQVDQRTADQRRRNREAEELSIARRVIDRVGLPLPGDGTHPLQRHRDSMG